MNRVLLVSVLLTFLLIGSLVPMTAAAQDNGEPLDEGLIDCVDRAIDDGSFTVFIEAVQAAGLEETLRGSGPFTIFAPTDGAFADLLAELGITEEELLAHPDLEEILLYQVVDDVLMEDDLAALDSATTLEGIDVRIDVQETNGSEIMIDRSRVMETDVECSNGVIHVIDKVLLPPELLRGVKDIVDTAVDAGVLTVLVEAIRAADDEGAFEGLKPFTAFVPANDAFAELLAEPGVTGGELFEDLDPEDIILYHVVDGRFTEADLAELDSLTTLQGSDVEIDVQETTGREITINDAGVIIVQETTGREITINGAEVIIADIELLNGVIHVIDEVLVPPA